MPHKTRVAIATLVAIIAAGGTTASQAADVEKLQRPPLLGPVGEEDGVVSDGPSRFNRTPRCRGLIWACSASTIEEVPVEGADELVEGPLPLGR